MLKQTTVFSLFIPSFSLNFFNIIFNFVCSPESRPYTKAAIGYPGYVVFPKAERLHWHKEILSFKISFGDVVIKPKNGSQRARNGSSRLIKGCRPTSCTVNDNFPYFPNVNRKKMALINPHSLLKVNRLFCADIVSIMETFRSSWMLNSWQPVFFCRWFFHNFGERKRHLRSSCTRNDQNLTTS